jgi:hypothetical protein
MVRNIVMGALGLAVGLGILYGLTWVLKKTPAAVVGTTIERFTQPH